jgi:hypothetical protein
MEEDCVRFLFTKISAKLKKKGEIYLESDNSLQIT